MKIRDFGVEMWMNAYENNCTYNLAETCVKSLTVQELAGLSGKGDKVWEDIRAMQLTYGDIEGSAALREGLCGLYETVRPENTTITHGAIGANDLVINALVEPGDTVISVLPTYQQLYSIPESLGAKVKICHLREENGFLPDLAELKSLVDGKTKLICINNASNPIGTVLDADTLGQIAEIARSVGAYVLCDEVYLPLENTEDFMSMADVYEKAIVTNSVSKTYSTPAARVGWVVADEEVSNRIRTYRDYTMICGGVFNDALATYVLEHKDKILERNRKIVFGNRDIAQAWIDTQHRVSWTAPQGVSTSFIQLDIPEHDEEFCKRLLAERGVLLVPGSRFELPCGARLGYCASEDVLREGLRLLGEALAEFDR